MYSYTSSPSTFIYLCTYLLAQCLPALGQSSDGEVDLSRTPLKYIPNKSWALIGAGCYAFTVAMCIFWSRRVWGRYMLAIILGASFYVIGLLLRIVYANDMTSIMKYAAMDLVIVLSPCGLIAGVYMLLSRLAIHLNAVEYLLLSPRWLTKVFVTSDVLTFLVQATGGGLTAIDDPDKRNLGKTLFLGGLIVQLISFLIYTMILAIFVFRLWTYRRAQWDARPEGFMKHWVALVWSMIISCVAIIIRSLFRTFENAEGRDGHLMVKEGYFYVLDCLVLWIAVTVFIVTWPPSYITNTGHTKESLVELTSRDDRV